MDIETLKPAEAPTSTDIALAAISRTILRQEMRLKALEGKATLTEAEMAEFRAIADAFARFIGEAKS